VGAVDRAPVQVQLASGAQLGEQQLVQRRPDAGLGPVAQPPPAGHPAAPDQCGGQLVPGDAGLEHEDDAGERGPVIDRPAARIPVAAGLGGGSSGAIRSHSLSGTSSSVTQASLLRPATSYGSHAEVKVKRSFSSVS
jgi:hypothetical protein